MQNVHFLHIGKTGGTAIKHALKPFKSSRHFTLFLHNHNTKLKDIPLGDRVVFFVRDPVSRFVSAYFSRQRQGQPRIHVPWTEGEKVAFEKFDSPNKLAVALSSADENERNQASSAMKSIGHIRTHFLDWFGDRGYLKSRRPDVLFVGSQAFLNADFLRLRTILGIPETAVLPSDEVHSHRNPTNVDKSLDETAVQNLKNWYQQDYKFIEMCRKHFGLQHPSD